MREINECTAEVFRRSEKRIKERKRNRNRLLAFCIPLCLIVTVWSIMIPPAMMPAIIMPEKAWTLWEALMVLLQPMFV